MAINFKNIARKATGLSDLMENRRKVRKADGVYKIVDFDVVAFDKGPYVICAINNEEYINGGFVLTKMFNAIIDACGGDVETARAEYKKAEPLTVRLSREMTKNGNNITRVEVI